MEALTKERRKILTQDLCLITLVSFFVLTLVGVFSSRMNAISFDSSINIVLRVLLVGVGAQFGLAGLGITIVCILRKEPFTKFGLNTKNLLPAAFFSLLCCIPELLYYLVNGEIVGWCPFWGVNFTKEVLASTFPNNVLGILIIATCWGFFEAFNYVVIRDKLSELLPSKYKFFDWGALICAIMCIVIHGLVGVTPEALIEMISTMILIYGMLIVRKLTGNAWGCILIFFVYWNAWVR